MSGKIDHFFKPISKCGSTAAATTDNPAVPPLSHTAQKIDATVGREEDTASNSSLDSVDLVTRNKRKRIEEDEEEGTSKRRSEEPLVKLHLNLVDETQVENKQNQDHQASPKKNPDNERSVKGEDLDDAVKHEQDEAKEKKKEEEEEEYEVERVVDYQFCKATNRGLYCVKWIGWPSEDNTWEPLEHLDCREQLVDFYNRRLETRKVASPAEKRMLEMPPDPREALDIRENYIRKNYVPPSLEKMEEIFKAMGSKKPPKLITDGALNKEIDFLARAKKPNEKKQQAAFFQLDLRAVKKYRFKQMDELKAWEKKINAVDNSALLLVENMVDLEGPPLQMEYVNAYKASAGITVPDDPPLGCECVTCDLSSTNCCSNIAGYDLAYTHFGKLRVDVGYPIYECNRRCRCPPTCRNRVVQKGRSVKLAIYRTENGCGWGVKTLEKIKAGSFVVQYVGEVITSEEAEIRGKKYDAEGRTYLFDLDFNLGDDNIYTVDAAYYGNLSHFINHSCDPNLNIFNVYINCLDPNLPQLSLFARRDINKGEQLTFDYCQSPVSSQKEGDGDPTTPLKQRGSGDGAQVASPMRTPKVATEAAAAGQPLSEKTVCRCGAANCRKVVF